MGCTVCCMETHTTYTISIHTPRRKDFDFAVGMIKRNGGKYDAATRTWDITIPTGMIIDHPDAWQGAIDRMGEDLAHIHAYLRANGWSDMMHYHDCYTIESIEVSEAVAA